MPTDSGPGPGPDGSNAPAPPSTDASTPLGGLLGSRKGILSQNVLVMVTIFSIGLTLAAVFKVLPWETAFKLGAVALGVFGVQSGTHTVGIAVEDAARFRATAAAPTTRIDASSSATQVAPPAAPIDPEATIDPGKPS